MVQYVGLERRIRTQTHIPTHTHRHKQTHTLIQTHVHTNLQRHTETQFDTCLFIYIYAHTHTHTHKNIFIWKKFMHVCTYLKPTQSLTPLLLSESLTPYHQRSQDQWRGKQQHKMMKNTVLKLYLWVENLWDNLFVRFASPSCICQNSLSECSLYSSIII